MLRASLKAMSVAMGLAFLSSPAGAEISEIVIAKQIGTAYIPIMMMERHQLIEKHVEAQGLPRPTTNWVTLAGPSAMNDGLISGSVHFGTAGVPPLALLWDRTGGGVKALGMICSYRMWLNTRNPNIKTIADFTEADRISVTGVKVSMMAINLQMEAEEVYGVGNHEKLDHLTVGLPHPEGLASLLNENSQITAQYTTSPFHERAIADPRIHTVTEAGAGVFLLGTTKFRDENPKTLRAVFDALQEGIEMANANPRESVELYKEMSGDNTPTDDLLSQMFNPDFEFTLTPVDVGRITQFLHRIGTLRTPVNSWKDLFFEEAHGLAGN